MRKSFHYILGDVAHSCDTQYVQQHKNATSQLYYVLRDCVEAATNATFLVVFTITLHSITAFFVRSKRSHFKKIVGRKLEFGLCNRVCVLQTENMCDRYRAGGSRKNLTKVTTTLPRPVPPASGGQAIQTGRMMLISESMTPVGPCAPVGSYWSLRGHGPLGVNLLKTPLIL